MSRFIITLMQGGLRTILRNVASHPGGRRWLAQECSALQLSPALPSGPDLPDFARSLGLTPCFSQEGEDLLLARLITEPTGFYADVGAHHPLRFSNTYGLYLRGWRGINIDAAPGSMEAFRQLRPDDVNLECAVSSRTEPLVFHVFEEGALNTFDAALAEQYLQAGWPRKTTLTIRPRPLAEVLDAHVPPGQSLDLLSVDVENEDLNVLQSNDWQRYRPRVVVVEALETSLEGLAQAPCIAFLASLGYRPLAKLFNSVVLADNR